MKNTSRRQIDSQGFLILRLKDYVRKHHSLVLPLLLLIGAVASGCCTSNGKVRPEHVVVINHKGHPLLVNTNGCSKMDADQYDRYLGKLTQAMRSYAATNGQVGTKRTNELVIFVHGGMNRPDVGVKRAVALTDVMLKDDVYPIFVNWNSSFCSSYLEHIWRVRRGNADYKGWAPLLAPFYFLSDLGGAVLKSPAVFFEGLWRTRQAIPFRRYRTDTQTNALEASVRMLRDHHSSNRHPDTISIEVGENSLSTGERWWEFAATTLNTPSRALFAPVYHSFGTPAWNMMLRRVDLMFEDEATSHRGEGGFLPPPGAMQKFARELANFLKSEKANTNYWTVTMIGHSMGGIVTTEFIERALMYEPDFPEIDNIVLMGSAGSQRDFDHAIVPYLRNHTNSVCSVLTLEMQGELWERHYKVLPQGSLLVWIDDYFSTPNSEIDHTLGRFTNLMLAAHRIPPDVRGRVSFRAFPYGRDELLETPLRHGDFSRTRFWRREFWDVRATSAPSSHP